MTNINISQVHQKDSKDGSSDNGIGVTGTEIGVPLRKTVEEVKVVGFGHEAVQGPGRSARFQLGGVEGGDEASKVDLGSKE